MTDPAERTPEPDPPPAFDPEAAARAISGVRRRARVSGGLLAGMRIRKKLIVLHTAFSLSLAVILLVALRPAVTRIVREAEVNQAKLAVRVALASAARAGSAADLPGPDPEVLAVLGPDVRVRVASGTEAGVTREAMDAARAHPREPVVAASQDAALALAYVPGARGAGGMGDDEGAYWIAEIRIPEARGAVLRIYALTIVALLSVYGLVAASLEVFVLPQHVYGPIRRMLKADRAVQEGDKENELIPEGAIPADELGEIMRSRNESIVSLRRHEKALAEALGQLERVATDLKRKNHLLEAAQRNLADADRLVSLGMMSAGIAHELNTPLAVIKGLVEKLNADPRAGMDPAQAALMLRVVGRLERLGESLLDFARVRPPRTAPAGLRVLVDEAVTLVRLDREAREVEYINAVDGSLVVECDADRMVQVLVNLLRNATDAVRARGEAETPAAEPALAGLRRAAGRVLGLEPERAAADPAFSGRVEVGAGLATKEGRAFVSLTVTDNGPGIDPELLSRLFEPFVSSRLDARGTGLGLAVSEGIVREHGGLLLARNRADGQGAVFEVVLPLTQGGYAGAVPPPAERPAGT